MNHEPGWIGPNAVIRLAEALRSDEGEACATAVFAAAGLLRYLAEPPSAMVDEREVTALYAALRASLPPVDAARVSAHAGRLTAVYLLGHRIPRSAQILLALLPARLAARALVRAIGAHAWTFAGSGRFSAEFGGEAGGAPLRFVIQGCPVCRGARSPEPLCDYYAATFEHLFRALVKPSSVVRETACGAAGAAACVFEVRW